MLTPNSYHARLQDAWYNASSFLEFKAKKWDRIKPQLVVKGHLGETRIVNWTDLKKGHENGKFNNFVRSQLATQFKGATELVLITHGFEPKLTDTPDCNTTWVQGIL